MAKTKQGSRLSRTLEQQSKKQLYFFLSSTILLISLLGFFSPRILDFIGSNMIGRGNQTEVNEDTIQIVLPPTFTEIPRASDVETITIKGTAVSNDSTVEVFVNNRKESVAKLSDSNTFEVKNIKLQEGENIVKGRSIIGDRKSEFTKDYQVHYTKEPPKIDEVSPSDGTEFKRGDQEIQVRGKTDPQNTVTVNNFRAVVDTTGIFSYFLKLNDGDNTIVIKAVNPAGKESTKEVTVKFSP